MEEPRIITSREVFENEFVTTWEMAMDMAIDKLKEVAQKEKKDFSMADILSATAQLSITYNQNRGYIESLKKEKQAKIDQRFGKQE